MTAVARRVTLVAWGSRGDVAPIVTLGRGLRAAGDQVTILASRDFETLVISAGLIWAPFDISIHEAARSRFGRAWLGGHRTVLGQGRALQRVLAAFTEPLIEGIWEHTKTADLVVSGILTADACASLTAARNQDHAVALLTPVMPSRHGPSTPTAVLQGQTSGLNELSGRAVLAASYHLLRVPGDQIRERLGHRRTRPGWLLDRLKAMPVLVGTSAYVAPQAPEHPNVTVTGYWPPFRESLGLDARARIEADISQAGDEGCPVAYLGFGSMTTSDPSGTAELLVESALAAGIHPVLGNGWSGMAAYVRDRDDVTLIEDVPHDWLFPRCDVVVHHGGAGTTGSALRSGTPQIVVTHMGDQPYWGQRVHHLGVAPPPLRRTRLTVPRLTATLRDVTSGQGAERRRVRAREIGSWIGAEKGVERAVSLLISDATQSPA